MKNIGVDLFLGESRDNFCFLGLESSDVGYVTGLLRDENAYVE